MDRLWETQSIHCRLVINKLQCTTPNTTVQSAGLRLRGRYVIPNECKGKSCKPSSQNTHKRSLSGFWKCEKPQILWHSLSPVTVVKTFIYLWLGRPKLTGKLSRKNTHISCHSSEICISIDHTLNNLVQRSFANDRKCFA